MAKSNSTSTTITLSKPIKRGDKEVTELNLCKPTTGSLRGLHITVLMQGNVEELTKLLPRITDPMLTEAEILDLEVEDLSAMCFEVSSFLATGKPSTV